jgi:hypothetical protein
MMADNETPNTQNSSSGRLDPKTAEHRQAPMKKGKSQEGALRVSPEPIRQRFNVRKQPESSFTRVPLETTFDANVAQGPHSSEARREGVFEKRYANRTGSNLAGVSAISTRPSPESQTLPMTSRSSSAQLRLPRLQGFDPVLSSVGQPASTSAGLPPQEIFATMTGSYKLADLPAFSGETERWVMRGCVKNPDWDPVYQSGMLTILAFEDLIAMYRSSALPSKDHMIRVRMARNWMSDAVDTLEQPPGFGPQHKALDIVSSTTGQPAFGPSSITPHAVGTLPDQPNLTQPLGQQSGSESAARRSATRTAPDPVDLAMLIDLGFIPGRNTPSSASTRPRTPSLIATTSSKERPLKSESDDELARGVEEAREFLAAALPEIQARIPSGHTDVQDALGRNIRRYLAWNELYNTPVKRECVPQEESFVVVRPGSA